MQQKDEIKYYRDEVNKTRCQLENIKAQRFSDDDIFHALVDYYDISDSPFDVVYKELSSDQMLSILRDYDFARLEVITSVELNQTLIPEGFPRYQQRAQVRVRGEIWQIHQYDKDPFPSNPHAHNYENNLKLHLGNGELYQRRKLISKIPKKELVLIREKISQQLQDLNLPELIV